MVWFGRDVKDDLVPTFHYRSGSSLSNLALKLCMGQQVVFDSTAWPGTTYCGVPGPVPASWGLLEMQQQQDAGLGGGFAKGMVCSGWGM